MSSNIDRNDVIKKEARGINDADFGEVQRVTSKFVITQRGLMDVEIFGLPKEKIKSYDGDVLLFDVSEVEALSRYRGEPTDSLSQGGEPVTSTLNETGTPLPK